MDDCWERSLPFVELDLDTASHLIHTCDPGLTVEGITPLHEGCRASVYCIRVQGGTRFLLKLFSTEDEPWKKERRLCQLLQEDVLMPQLYGAGKDNVLGGSFALYGFVPGMSLRHALQAGVRPGDELLERIGHVAATIHRHACDTVGFLDADLRVQQALPPVRTWYTMFLGPRAQGRLGQELTARVRAVVEAGEVQLVAVDVAPTLVHGDLRPTNIMVNDQQLSGIVDWEFAMAGHPLADVGQFFRYQEDFGMRERQAFERGYNSVPGMCLPPGWEHTGKLCDLANLLQMIDAEGEHPRKDADLKRLIERTVSP
jgi:aminoglycoside phosphotransferase (APT) family kinase protein